VQALACSVVFAILYTSVAIVNFTIDVLLVMMSLLKESSLVCWYLQRQTVATALGYKCVWLLLMAGVTG
jgi:hypothetical protein